MHCYSSPRDDFYHSSVNKISVDKKNFKMSPGLNEFMGVNNGSVASDGGTAATPRVAHPPLLWLVDPYIKYIPHVQCSLLYYAHRQFSGRSSVQF